MSRRSFRPALARTPLLCLAVLACGPAGRSAAGDDSARAAANDPRCLVAPPLAGLRLGDTVTAVRAAVGQPLDSVRLVAEGDTGPVDLVTYRFPRADVDFVAGRVDRIVVTGTGGWPRGLAVGSTRAEVDQYAQQHRLVRTASADTIQISVCPGHWALLHMVPSAGGRRVGRVELTATRPERDDG
jgi:hypothetical protein